MSDSLDDRLGKQKAAGSAKQQAYLQAMRDRVAREDAERMAQRVPRAQAYFSEMKTAIATRIGQLARAKKGQPGLESLVPFPVSGEFDGTKVAGRDVRIEHDSAHGVWLEFVEWGEIGVAVVEVDDEPEVNLAVGGVVAKAAAGGRCRVAGNSHSIERSSESTDSAKVRKEKPRTLR